MSNYATLKSAIQSAVYTNGNGEITGAGLQAVLLQIVNTVGDGYVFKGVATGGTSPGTPDDNVFYIGGAGTYTNFGSSYTVKDGELGIFMYNGSWSKSKFNVVGKLANGLNISALFPTGGSGGGDTYTLDGAIAAVPAEYQKGGLCITFFDGEQYVIYQLVSENWSTATEDWQAQSSSIMKEYIGELNKAIYRRFGFVPDLAGSNHDFAVSDENGNCIVIFNGGELMTKNFDSSKMQLFTSSQIYDFAISDEQGNCIVVFEGGHVKTKYFDSSKPIQNSRWAEKNLSILGDSISTYSGYSQTDTYPRGDVTSVSQMWWKIVADYFGMNILKIDAIGGSCVTDGVVAATCMASDARTSALNDGATNPDVIICEAGINDFYHNSPLGNWDGKSALSTNVITTFSEAFANMLRKLQANYPAARIFAMLPPLNWHSGYTDAVVPANSHGVYFQDYIDVIRTCCDAFGVPLISVLTSGITTTNAFDYTLDDPALAAFHPNAEGMKLYAEAAIKEMNY